MGEYVGDAITSVINGSFDDFELIVIDDGSTDDTRSVVEQFTRREASQYDQRVRYYHQKNAGKSAAINHVLRKVEGAYVAILDADDELPADGLTERYQPVQRNGNKPDLVIGGFEVFREDKKLGKRGAPNTTDLSALRRAFFFNYKTPFHLNSCLFRCPMVHKVGGFDHGLRRAQDQDYSLRLLTAAEEISIVDSAVYRYRKYRDTLTERIGYRLKNLRYRSQMISKHTAGVEWLAAVGFGVMLDLGKTVYELGVEYHN
jgi:glycosyltransferase involved in cell wall biosynthesis